VHLARILTLLAAFAASPIRPSSVANAQAAKRYVILHELRAIREGTMRLNKDARVA